MTRLEIIRNQSNKINDGFLLVDKPQKMTCNDLCQVLKRRYNIKSCGHSGTLDPDATGVMILAFGRATKLLSLLDKEDKTYLATICYGILTDTLDIGGKIIGEKPVNITAEMVKEATTKLSLATTQIPPMMAAIKINGKKLYEYQRANQEVEVKPRACQIIDYELIEPLKIKEKNYTTSIKLHVTKGYYIRSFARDLGDLIDTYATLLDLRRIKAGSIDISQCLTLDKILTEEKKEEEKNTNEIYFLLDESNTPFFDMNKFSKEEKKHSLSLVEKFGKSLQEYEKGRHHTKLQSRRNLFDIYVNRSSSMCVSYIRAKDNKVLILTFAHINDIYDDSNSIAQNYSYLIENTLKNIENKNDLFLEQQQEFTEQFKDMIAVKGDEHK